MASSWSKLKVLCGQGGLNASKSPDLMRDTDLKAMESLTFENDTWQKEGGAVKFNSVAVPPLTSNDPEIRSMHHFRTQAGVHELVCATRVRRLVVVDSSGVTKTIMNEAGEQFVHSPFVEGFNGSLKALYYFGATRSGPRVYTGAGEGAIQLGAFVGNVTANSGTDTFTLNSHGLANTTKVFFANSSGGSLPNGIVPGGIYFVINTAANTFQVSLSQGGAAFDFTNNGTGTNGVYRLTIPADWQQGIGNPRWGFMHRGRMYGGGTSDHPHDVYTSVLNNHNDYLNTGALYFQVYPGEGDIIVGGVSWREKAYLFKFPKGIYVLDDASLDVADWGWKRVSQYVGAIGQGSIVEADDEVYFVSPNGFIHALSAVQEEGDVQSSAVKAMEVGSYIQQYTDFSKLNTGAWPTFANYPQPQAIYYATKRKLLFAFSANPNVLSAQDFPVNKVLIGFDIHRSTPGMKVIQPFVTTRDEYESFAIYRNPTTGVPELLAGDSNGFIYKLDQTAHSKDGAGYMGSFETKEFYPYQDERKANLHQLEVTWAPDSSSNSLTIKVYMDGVLAKTKTLSDTDRWMRLDGDCRKVKIIGENNTLNSSFSVATITVFFTPGNANKR